MAVKWTIEKLAAGQKAATPTQKAKKGDPTPAGFVLTVGTDGSVTVFGQNNLGKVDISAVATLTAVSRDPSIATVDAPVGMSYNEHPVSPGDTVVDLVATWIDGSVGPFPAGDAITIQQAPPGPVTGLIVIHNPPVPVP
jgi:hypothetical protein